jgi:tyrosyl-tRNA synthetase
MIESIDMADIDNRKLIHELEERGLVYQFSTEKLDEIFSDKTQKIAYLGADPTADSFHVGNLVTYIMAQHLLNAGHKVILLIGGATGLIGDPSGKDGERPFADESVILDQSKKLQKQLHSIDGLSKMKIVNNYDWFKKINVLEFLRDTGKHFTVNAMMKKESVARRLESENGISFTEFSYALIQGYDYYHLHLKEGCDLQIGGSDQWGNIISGVEFVRRKLGKKVDALTLPLVVDKATGKKFGKTAGNAIWLDPAKTTYYDFYQFWFNTDDGSVIDYLKLFTFLSLDEISQIKNNFDGDPGSRSAQTKLAYEVTKFVHGSDVADSIRRVSEIVFSNDPIWDSSKEDLKLLMKFGPVRKLADKIAVTDALIETGLASSKREAREFMSNGAIRINGEIIDIEGEIAAADFNGDLVILQRGKRNKALLMLE